MGRMGQQSQAARKDAAGYFNPHVAAKQNQDNYQAATPRAPIVVVMVVPTVSPPTAGVAVVGVTSVLRRHSALFPSRRFPGSLPQQVKLYVDIIIRANYAYHPTAPALGQGRQEFVGKEATA